MHITCGQYWAIRLTWKCSCRRTRSWCSPGSLSRKKQLTRWDHFLWGVLPTRHKLLWTISALKRQAEEPDDVNNVPRGDAGWTKSWPCLEERWVMLWHGEVFGSGLSTQNHCPALKSQPGWSALTKSPVDGLYRTSEEAWVPTCFFSVSLMVTHSDFSTSAPWSPHLLIVCSYPLPFAPSHNFFNCF